MYMPISDMLTNLTNYKCLGITKKKVFINTK